MKKILHKKIRLFIVLCFLFSPPAYSNTPVSSPAPITAEDSAVLIRAAKTNLTEFSAYIKTESIKTYAQYQLALNRKTPRPVILESLLKQAQMEFLSYEPERSIKTFRLITGHIHSFDWNKQERKIIFYSLFRLAQMEKDPQKQKLLLREALAFEMDLKLDLQLFPPPLTTLYLQMKKTAVFVPLDLKKLFPGHEIVLINGKVHSHKEKVTLPYGVYRITAFSSSHTYYTQTLSLSRFISKTIKTPSVVGGSCQQPAFSRLDKNLNQSQIHILFPNFCLWNPIQHRLAEKKNTLASEIQQIAQEDLKEPAKQSKWEKEEWILLGAAILVLGTATFLSLKKNNKKSDEKAQEKPDEKAQEKPIIKIGFKNSSFK